VRLRKTLRWRDGFHPIDACGAFALIILRDPPNGQGSCGSCFHQEALKTVDHCDITTS
jgi:hypothetical protein